MRLIDADKVINAMQKCLDKAPDKKDSVAYFAFESIIECLKQEPTVDAVEVVHGEWIMVIDENDCECIECPLCGEQFYDGDNDTFDKPYNYCPNCGAKMDGDGNA